MIPPDLRFNALYKGLLDTQDTQYRYAAAVGLQYTPAIYYDHAPEAERVFRNQLLQYAKGVGSEDDEFLQERAFVAVYKRLHYPRDLSAVLDVFHRAVNHHNALAWLLVNVPKEEMSVEWLKTQLEEHGKAQTDETEKTAESSSALPPSSPTAFTPSEIDTLLAKLSPSIERHLSKATEGVVSAAANLREPDIPDYARLQWGTMDEEGAMKLD